MPLENAVTIQDLNNSWPLSGDGVSEGDDHLRQEKIVLKNIFPGVGGNGFNVPITATEAELNFSSGVTSALQAQIDAITANISANGLGIVPIGAIIQYNGLFSAIPANYQLCDGTNSTPDMTDKFVYGTNTQAELGNAGGTADAVNISHNHTFAGNAVSDHTHGYTLFPAAGGSFALDGASFNYTSSAGTTDPSGAHTPSGSISTDGVSGTNLNIPPYIKLAFIRRMS